MPPSTTRRYSQSVRAQSAEDTGRRIVESFLARLMRQWFDEITLDAVAADAGVTVQTVVRRFGGKDGLLSVAVKVLADRINAQRVAPPRDLERLVENLVADYEQNGDMVMRLLSSEGKHAALKEVLDFGRGQHRQWVTGAFEENLKMLDEADRARAVDALIIATDVYTWKLLRRDMEHSPEETRERILRLIRAILFDFLSAKNHDEKP